MGLLREAARSSLLLVCIAIWCFSNGSDAAPRCTPCIGSGVCSPPQYCPYGYVKDYCGRSVCAKGPGQRCGGKWSYFGTCGEGLICTCGRCGGCSLKTLECFSVTCIGAHV